MTPEDLDRVRESRLVRGIEFHQEIGSTNDRAAQLAGDDSIECPYLVIAARQTAGRGRGSNAWWSAPGALAFSLILEPRRIGIKYERWPLVALASGLAVCEAVKPFGRFGDAALKWPNDVYVHGKKIAGILVEAPAVKSERLVVGIGVNVNNGLSAAPQEIQKSACALCEVAGRPLDLASILIDVLGRLSGALEVLAKGTTDLVDLWRPYCLLTGKRVTLTAANREFSGRCRGINERGELVLDTPDGTQSFRSGSVTWLEN
jgi:BirA family biotin operon repressor/biotin-[acetyl-CoA-carboxylase] ligase